MGRYLKSHPLMFFSCDISLQTSTSVVNNNDFDFSFSGIDNSTISPPKTLYDPDDLWFLSYDRLIQSVMPWALLSNLLPQLDLIIKLHWIKSICISRYI